MLTVTVEFHLKEGALEELRERVEQKVLPVAQGCDGFLGGAFVDSPDHNRAFEVIFWQDRESYDRFSNSEAFSRAQDGVGQLFRYPPSVIFYENTRLVGKIFDRKAVVGYK